MPFTGSLLIIKNPQTGAINTLVANGDDGIVQVNAAFKSEKATASFASEKSLIVEKIGSFSFEPVNFCVNMNGYGKTDGRRQNVRIAENARGASGVLIVGMDSEENACN